jgi:hypothetical protein
LILLLKAENVFPAVIVQEKISKNLEEAIDFF